MRKTILILMLSACCYGTFCWAANELAPPKYEVSNRHFVNMSTGHVQVAKDDVTIGGKLGLTHKISTYSSDFVNYWGASAWGFNDSHRGGLYNAVHNKNAAPNDPSKWLYVLRAFGIGSHDFIINGDGTYTPLQDPRYSLEFIAGMGYKLTTADGTTVTYPSSKHIKALTGPGSVLRAPISTVESPTGFKTTVHMGATTDSAIYSVTTNTGYQLKYIYEVDTRPVPYAVARVPDSALIPPANAENWSAVMPKYIKAVNNAVDYCAPTSAPCSFSRSWPTVTYEWPAGMPKAMFVLDDSVFKHTDATGLVTEYHHNVYVSQTQDSVLPRVTKIVDGATGNTIMNYAYENKMSQQSSSEIHSIWQSTGDAVLKKSWLGDDQIGYSIGNAKKQSGVVTGAINAGGGYKNVNLVESTNFGVPSLVTSWDQSIYFDHQYHTDLRNINSPSTHIVSRVKRIVKTFGGGEIDFYYDARGNLNRRVENGISTQAGFPTNCSNRKTCNKPTWISDGNGNKTYFTYHAQSGQIASITSPPDAKGINAKTVYGYSPKFAHYKKSNNSIQRADSAIWLLDFESKCLNSRHNGSSSGNVCAAGDEIRTHYEYDYYNLQLIGVAVTTGGETRRTCYQYDDFGNKIGEISPRANKPSCAN